jgi:hypothetical protein
MLQEPVREGDYFEVNCDSCGRLLASTNDRETAELWHFQTDLGEIGWERVGERLICPGCMINPVRSEQQ